MISFSYETLIIVLLIIFSIGLSIFGLGNTIKGSLTYDKNLENKGCGTLLFGAIILVVCIILLF